MRDASPSNFFISVPQEYSEVPDVGWWDGFKSTVAYNNMPIVETYQEAQLFGDVERDPKFDFAANVKAEYLPYVDDLMRAKNLDHLRYLEGRVQTAVDRRSMLSGAPLSSQLAGSVVDPLFVTTFIPGLQGVGLGKTIGSAVYNSAKVGMAYGVASELRRAPFAVGDEPFESTVNVATDTALSGVFGGILKGATGVAPRIKSTSNKLARVVRGEKINHVFKETEAAPIFDTGVGDYDAKVSNPFGSFIQRMLDDPTIPQDVKEIGVKMTYNSSVPLAGTGRRAMPQSVAQRAFVYEGSARRVDDMLHNLHAEEALGQKKASTFMGAYTADFNPMNKEFDTWLEDTITRYIKSTSPDPAMVREARDGLSDQQKRAFTVMKEFFEAFDQDARYVGLLMDDVKIRAKIDDINATIAEKAEQLDALEASIRKGGGATKKQGALEKALDSEMAGLRAQLVQLEDVLDSPTRKNYVFPIYYDKLKLKDDIQRQGLTEKFTEHYRNEGLPDPQQSAENTLMRIMEEAAEDLEDSMPAGMVGNAKHLKHRKTNVDEHMINDYMVKSIDVFYTYAARMGKKIEFHRAFDGKTVDEVLSDIETSLRKAGKSDAQVAEIKAGFVGEYDRLMGSLMKNPDRWDTRLSKFAKSYAGWAYLPWAGVSAISDAGTIVMAHGLKDVVAAGGAAFRDNLVGKTFKEATYANVAVDLARATAQQRILGDSVKRVQMNPLEKVENIGNRFFYTANALSIVTTSYKSLDQILINDKFIKLSRKMKDNSISQIDREYMFRYGIDDELASYITEMPTQRADSSKFEMANTDEWPRATAEERMMLRRYQAATAAHADNAVVMGQAFDRPLIMDGVVYMKDNPYFAMMRKRFPNMYKIDERASTGRTKMVRIESGTMTIPFTFMNFVFGANNKILGAVRDPNRRYRLQGALTLLGLSYVSFEIKSPYWWRKEDESADMIARLVDHSGLVGIYSDLGYMGLSMAGNMADKPEDFFIEPKYISRDKDERLMDGLTEPLGAPVGLALGYARGFKDYMNGDFTEGNRELIYNTPILSFPLIRGDLEDLANGTNRSRF